MKKIAITLISSLVLFSCTEDFITKEPLGVESNFTFYDNPVNCDLAVNAMYDVLQWEELYARNTWSIGDICSDDNEKGGGNDLRTYKDDQLPLHELCTFTATGLNPYLVASWKAYYIGIARANAMLDQTTEFVNGKDSVVYKRMRAEATFLRAMFYFDMVKIFGPVPLVTTTVLPAESVNIGNRDVDNDPDGSKQIQKIYQQLIEDLTKVEGDLPWTYTSEYFGKATRTAANALLAKIYLYNKDYANAYKVANDLINNPNNVNALESHYQDIFDMDMNHEQSPEIVFSVQYISGTGEAAYGRGGEGTFRPIYTTPRYFQLPNGTSVKDDTYGYGFDMPRQVLVDAFNPADPRLDCILKAGDSLYCTAVDKIPSWKKIGKVDWNTGYYCTKGMVNYDKYAGYNTQAIGKDFAVIRWAEVLLIAAEAGVQSGHIAEATQYINDIRERARNSNRVCNGYNDYTYTPGAIPADLATVTLDDVKTERRLELYNEAQRYFDIVRWGDADALLGAKKKDVAGNPVYWNPATLGRFPIPQSQIILHTGGNLMQNPGY